MEAIAGKDDKDSTSIGRDDYSFTKALVDDVKGMRIGIQEIILEKVLTLRLRKLFLPLPKFLRARAQSSKSLI